MGRVRGVELQICSLRISHPGHMGLSDYIDTVDSWVDLTNLRAVDLLTLGVVCLRSDVL